MASHAIVAAMNILLAGAASMMIAALILAWVATFSKLMVVQSVAALIKDYGALIRAHIDLLLMALLCFSLYATRLPLPSAACWPVVIGGFSNPCLFLIRALDPRPSPGLPRKVFRMTSFVITTIGHGWIATSILMGLLGVIR